MFIEQVDANEERVLIKTTLETMGTVYNVNFRKNNASVFTNVLSSILVQFSVWDIFQLIWNYI